VQVITPPNSAEPIRFGIDNHVTTGDVWGVPEHYQP